MSVNSQFFLDQSEEEKKTASLGVDSNHIKTRLKFSIDKDYLEK
jgi:hypothetical protein